MELVFTTEEKVQRKTYRHFSISSTESKETVDKKKADFFYIGRKSSSIDCLIKSFETGYAAENIDNAKFILNRLTTKENTVPGVFIIDASLSAKEISDIFSFVSNIADMSAIPFIVDASQTTLEEVESIRKMEFVDEIVFLNDFNSQKLFAKINFLKKIKARSKALLGSCLEPTFQNTASRVLRPSVIQSLACCWSLPILNEGRWFLTFRQTQCTPGLPMP